MVLVLTPLLVFYQKSIFYRYTFIHVKQHFYSTPCFLNKKLPCKIKIIIIFIQTILILISTRPYKSGTLNGFTIMNEFFLFIIGCYMFIFIDENLRESQKKFYGWIIICLVVLMSILNMGFIIPYKIMEVLKQRKIN